MREIVCDDKVFHVDTEGFLVSHEEWNEAFAKAIAPEVGIFDGLTATHWEIIRFIRQTFNELGRCPLVYQTCKFNNLHLKELKSLFPTGYLRGACKLAGITYKDSYVKYTWAEQQPEEVAAFQPDKTYEIDVHGFLVHAHEWDERFAVCKAGEMKLPGGLSERHWKVISYLRRYYHEHREIPTVYQTCEANDFELEDLERLFPDGYHRGAVKIAGLCVR
jgi:tRNA 2-thiouridine synthesizing protein E